MKMNNTDVVYFHLQKYQRLHLLGIAYAFVYLLDAFEISAYENLPHVDLQARRQIEHSWKLRINCLD